MSGGGGLIGKSHGVGGGLVGKSHVVGGGRDSLVSHMATSFKRKHWRHTTVPAYVRVVALPFALNNLSSFGNICFHLELSFFMDS